MNCAIKQRSLNFLFPLFLAYLFILQFSSGPLYGQRITTLLPGNDNDSSYYHLTRISDNEFWACGEHGIITSFDTLGNVKSLPIPTMGRNILKAQRFEDWVILSTDDGSLMKYHLPTQKLITSTYKKYGNQCFYDFVILPKGKIILCGGNTGISKGALVIPKGFIAITDTSLAEPQDVWQSLNKFVWSILGEEEGALWVAAFNGFHSYIMGSEDGGKEWENKKKVEGLVHEIKSDSTDHEIKYVGTKTIDFKKDGILSTDGKNPIELKNSGCIWSQEIQNGHHIACSQNGDVFHFAGQKIIDTFKLPSNFAVYDLEFISKDKILLVGHGKCAYLLDFLREKR